MSSNLVGGLAIIVAVVGRLSRERVAIWRNRSFVSHCIFGRQLGICFSHRRFTLKSALDSNRFSYGNHYDPTIDKSSQLETTTF